MFQQVKDDSNNGVLLCLQIELPIAEQPELAAAVRSTLHKSRSKGNFLRIDEGEQSVVLDVTQLHKQGIDPALRRALLDEALETQEQDNEELLRKYRARLDRWGVWCPIDCCTAAQLHCSNTPALVITLGPETCNLVVKLTLHHLLCW